VEKIKMTQLTQQLEDKKKGCGCITAGNEEFGTMNCGYIWGKWDEDKWIDDKEPTYCDNCKAEIAILEQAIAEIEKQRQEILDKIDELEFTNIVRMNSNLGANTTQDRIKEYIKQQLNQQKTEE
jgi:hypothetical protein